MPPPPSPPPLRESLDENHRSPFGITERKASDPLYFFCFSFLVRSFPFLRGFGEAFPGRKINYSNLTSLERLLNRRTFPPLHSSFPPSLFFPKISCNWRRRCFVPFLSRRSFGGWMRPGVSSFSVFLPRHGVRLPLFFSPSFSERELIGRLPPDVTQVRQCFAEIPLMSLPGIVLFLFFSPSFLFCEAR